MVRKNAFTLIELSIVLIIIGLLVGGVLAGRDLIKQAELRSVATEFQNYQTAVRTFQLKYDAIPGDMETAEDFWGTMSTGTCPDATAGTGTETCNGNGDNGISFSTGTESQTEETFLFWQHLGNAGLIDGTYTGIAGTGRADDADPGVNAPGSKVAENAVWTVQTNNWSGSAYAFLLPSTMHNFLLGRDAGNWPNLAILTPAEAKSIDLKLDDGHATEGKVWAVRWDTCTPATSASDYEDYDLSETDIECGLVFLEPF